jgi:hypothetical protein
MNLLLNHGLSDSVTDYIHSWLDPYLPSDQTLYNAERTLQLANPAGTYLVDLATGRITASTGGELGAPQRPQGSLLNTILLLAAIGIGGALIIKHV